MEFIMMTKSAKSRATATAMVSGGMAMVCLAGAWLGPAGTARPTGPDLPAAAGSSASSPTVYLVTDNTPLHSALQTTGGPGGGPGGGSDGSPGDAVAPAPTRHGSNGESSSSASGGSAGGHASAPRDSGPVDGVFKTVGRWLGLSPDNVAAGGDSAGAKHPAGTSAKGTSANSASTDSAAQTPDRKPTAGLPEQAGSAGGAAGKSSPSSTAPDVGGLIHDVLSGVGQLLGSLFGH
jgi:hypothetical protein